MSSLPTAIDQIRVLKSFVSPHLCVQLTNLGVSTASPFKWYRAHSCTFYTLHTYAWDTCNIYKSSDFAFWASLNETPVTIEAFSSADIEAALPPFLLTKLGLGQYTITLDNFYHEIPELNQARLPDLYAALLIQLLKKRILKPAEVNLAMS